MEAIYLQTDRTFNLVQDAIAELRRERRLDQGIRQGARICRIERALNEEEEEEDEEEEQEQQQEDPRYTWRSINDFARTASACFRMAMMEAMGIDRKYWPRINSFQQNTREGNMIPADIQFHLTENRREAKRYSSKYKMLYESNDIIQKYRDTAARANVPLDSVMVIFRNNFTEMIKITTAVHLQKGVDNDRVHHASVRVLCEKHAIAPDQEGDDARLPAFHKLRRAPDNAELIQEAIQVMNALFIQ